MATERLVDSLWPDDPPENAAQALYSHVSRLRRHLGPLADRLERQSNGYRLRLEPFELDADAARRLAPDDPQAALELWRGPALVEFRSVPELEIASVGLDELRLKLVDDVLEARLARRGPDVVAGRCRRGRGRTAARAHRAAARAGSGGGRSHRGGDGAPRRRSGDGWSTRPGSTPRRRWPRWSSRSPPGPSPRPPSDAGSPGRTARWSVGSTTARRCYGCSAPTPSSRSPGPVASARPGWPSTSRRAWEARPRWWWSRSPSSTAPDRVGQAVASSLGLRITGEVGPDRSPLALADRDLLLVLDNCEHVIEACRELVVALRRVAPGVRVLATSRVTLQVPGEYVVRLQPLPVPRDLTDLDALRRQPSVRAFVEHARRRRPDFELTPEDAGPGRGAASTRRAASRASSWRRGRWR